MPTAYLLAKDRIEQARAMLANEVWFDAGMDHLLSVALARLDELDAGLSDDAPKVVPNPSQASPRIRLMPWLDKP
ncbi:hypothetical protein OF122_16310 [Pelagibacterium flavum]|uniref:Uncharacterized protein n=1 Tax=Pelagibacterium flavum TaxID=2984530 RepID=A0ABY6IM68_9HYPH|nr:hypothetical protein [Pelagibacterium sp. YIM 151497]MAN77658.1 hypothetical protein [Hyphomicrobiales bacterium]UYQ71591.1 hypothetical protein OF122_16310 [Pelagibacterium sp. YIM 151497]|tara:strand:- start:125 stop:349 length:225 start_codon:yes stop_codon:yes gene_type:complete